MKPLVALAGSLLSTVTAAQKPLQTELDTLVPALSHSWNHYRLATMPAAPTERLPALAKAGAVPTAKLAYMAWRTDPGNDTLNFARSTDGGVTWTKAVVFKVAGTETIYDMAIGAEGHTVFVCWIDNRVGQNAPRNVYITGSEDQGLTFSQPVLINTASAKTGGPNFWPDLMQMSVTRDETSKNVRAHVLYEYGDNRTMHPMYQGTEAPTYVAVEMAAGKPVVAVAERDISTVPSGKNKDVDHVSIHARGNVVLAYWRNDRNTYSGSGTSFNQVFGNLSADGGRTWGQDFLLGTGLDPKINGVTGSSNNDPGGQNIAIDGAKLYWVWNDRSHNETAAPKVRNNERLILAYSLTLGRTWLQKPVTTYDAGMADVDEHVLLAENGRVVIVVTSDERGRHRSLSGMNGTLSNTPADRIVTADNQGDANFVDQVQIFISNDAGRTFTGQWLSRNSIDDGTVKETQNAVNFAGPFKAKGTNMIYCKNVQAAMRGDVIQVCWEEHWYSATQTATGSYIFQGEDLVMRQSFDGGKTWSDPVNVTMHGGEARGYQTANGKNGDIDSPRMVLNGNRQSIVGFREQDPHGSTTNLDRPQAVARSHVEIETRFQGAQGLEMRNLPAGEAGHLAIVLGTVDRNPTPWVVPGLFGNLGFEPNLVPDGVTNLMLGLLPVFAGFVPAGGGTLTFPAAPPQGGNIFVVGITFDLQNGSFRSFTARGRF